MSFNVCTILPQDPWRRWTVTMSDRAGLANPITDVRDIVETFRLYGIPLSNWRETLSAAIDMLDRLPDGVRSDNRVSVLVPRLHHFINAGLTRDDPTLNEVSSQVEALLDNTRIPGIPRPDDQNWDFEEFTETA